MKCEVNASQNGAGKYNGKYEAQVDPSMRVADRWDLGWRNNFKFKLRAGRGHAATFVSSLLSDCNK